MISRKNRKFQADSGAVTMIDDPSMTKENQSVGHPGKLDIQRFRCTYERCRRVLTTDRSRPFRCTACGHGYMQLQESRNHCCECGAPIYSRVRQDCDVVCETCTYIKVAKIELLEKDSGVDIRNTRDFFRAKDILEKRKEEEQSSGSNDEQGKRVLLTTISKKRRKI